MSRLNFIDPTTGKKYHIPSFKMAVVDGNVVYKDKYGKIIKSPENGSILDPIPIEGPIEMPLMAKFTPTSESGRKNLKKLFGGRARKFDTKGAGGEEKKQKETEFKNQVIERAKEGKI